MNDSLLPTPTLRDLAAPDVTNPTAGVIAGRLVVVLGSSALGTVEVWDEGHVQSHPDDTTIEPIADPEHEQTMVRRALASLNQQRLVAEQQLATDAAQQAEELDRIRRYAIEAHQDGSVRRHELDEFLRTFNLQPYQDWIEVSFTISGRYCTTRTDQEAVRSADATALSLTVASICDLDEGSVEYDVAISAVEPAEGAEGQLRVSYEISGGFVIRHRELDHARTEVAVGLRPDLSGIQQMVEGSAVSELQLHGVELAD
jgi:hypothetical protein